MEGGLSAVSVTTPTHLVGKQRVTSCLEQSCRGIHTAPSHSAVESGPAILRKR